MTKNNRCDINTTATIMQEKTVPIRYVKGVGPRRDLFFKKIGVETVSDLFYYLPRRYEDRSRIVGIRDLKAGDEYAIVGRVTKCNVFRARTGTVITEATISDPTGRIYAIWYNMPFLKNVFSGGETVLLYGKVELYNRLQMTHPVYEIMDKDNKKGSLEIGRIVPVYPLIKDISQKQMRKIVHSALESYVGQMPEFLPTAVRARKKLVDVKFAMENIHFPYSVDNLKRAYRRLIFEEFFILQVIMAKRRHALNKEGIAHEPRKGLLKEFEEFFPFTLTGEQKKCITDIEKDMTSERPMYRLLQGDVGSGKTVVAMYAILLSVRNGYQSVLMAPTEILARQHFITVSKTLMPLGLNIRLLADGMDERTRGVILGEIASGEADIVIGTHSVFQKNVQYSKLGMIVIDEQHKFGVDQREELRKKNIKADTLVMTATPIPRSLALTVYGDMDISVLKEKPRGRMPIETYWAGEEERSSVYKFLRHEISEGRQAFIVCPRIKKEGKTTISSAEGVFEGLSKGTFSDMRLALVHGRMKPEEKDKIMAAFLGREYDILIATTLVEVGIDVPNATVMLIEDADRYGLAQLHQLRGRIGRGSHTSYCILMGEPGTEVARERLSAIAEIEDGFEIAERDLDLRGPGEFLGTRQSGLPELKVGSIVRDFEIMEEARQEAFDLIKTDPDLKEPGHEGVRASIEERFRGKGVV